ncbi:hypothetical protein [Paractinoplanes brasiliensis]|uniref:LPXTG-motif cell wall-anchored protein n=1 Tax=Paractinoplanes brasiliensis TaxID=52695 RepID=A0A4R6JWB5_9ACTN|nr:hypothetical protein [Actinoplanes brasiliensis]TDO41024.1 hypothetical protein C8E87_4750 [Actinoplanes brasiliensis]GID26093.1 hypothetical protein Abr02nite_10760 [Actinoplanes brasiliensis]
MRRSAYRRAAATPSGRNRRLFAVGAVIAALGAAVGFAQISGAAENDRPEGSGAGKVVNGQVILTDTCVDSNLPAHDGFQVPSRCISTEFGEVGEAKDNPSLLITEAPERVAANTPFTLKVSTRNLIRDRFLAAGKGGYYVESSVLKDGLVRGHFHTACRMLSNTNEAPEPDPVPAFFVATEDSKGGAGSDEVTIQVPGMPTDGIAQCASWAGDGSHRTPMMVRANQTPAIDSVRIVVGNAGGGNNGGGNNGGGNNGGGNNGGGNNGGGNNGGGNNGGGNNGGGTPGNPNSTVAPTKPPTKAPTTAPTVKDDFTPDPTKPATTKPTTKPTKPATTQPPAAGNSTTGNSDTGGSNSESGSNDKADDTDTPATTAPKPRSTSKSPAPAAGGTDYTYDDGQFNSGNKAPVADQVAQVQAESAKKDEGGLLALTGNNTVAVVGGAAVLLMIGLIIMALTRRRSLPGSTWE